MKNYSVKEISELLKVNDETVRRWIRDDKLHANKSSRKTGNVVSEKDLILFLESVPKYANIARKIVPYNQILGVTASAISIIAEVLKASPLQGGKGNKHHNKSKNMTADDLKDKLDERVADLQKSIDNKKRQIEKLQQEISSEEIELKNIEYVYSNFDDIRAQLD